MIAEDLQQVEAVVLDWVQEAVKPLTIGELLQRPEVEERRMSLFSIRHATWNLIDQGILEFTGDRHLKLRSELSDNRA